MTRFHSASMPRKPATPFTALAFLFLFSLACASTLPRAPKAVPLRGLYVPNPQANRIAYIKEIIARGKPFGVNMLVLDAHPFMMHVYRINPEVIDLCKKEGFYLAARVVCFQNGLASLPVPEEKLDRLFKVIESAAEAGFDEIQLDYIRFPDGPPYYSLAKKYEFIDSILTRAKAMTDRRKKILSADLFGRVVFNRDDIIGQKVELFARHVGVIYPMLYPSHFSGDTRRLSNPGETVLEGTRNGISRVKGSGVKIHPFIQAFPYNIQWARVPLAEYVRLQVIAVESTESRGWVAWNPKGDYEAVFAALSQPQ